MSTYGNGNEDLNHIWKLYHCSCTSLQPFNDSGV